MGELNLLAKPEFLAYLKGLPNQSFHGVLVIDEAGRAKELVTTQEGDSPPVVSASPTKENDTDVTDSHD